MADTAPAEAKTTPTTTAAPTGDTKPTAGAAPAAPAAVTPPAGTVTPPAAPKPAISPQLAELNKRDWQIRTEKKKLDDEKKAIAASVAERKANEDKWRADPQSLLEAFGYTVDGAIDILAKGGADSAEGRVRALETKLERQEREAKEAEEKKKNDADAAARKEARRNAQRYVKSETDRLLKDPRFEFCAAEDNMAREVEAVIRGKWDGVPELDEYGDPTGKIIGGGEDCTVEQALELLETVLDARLGKHAQSSKLKAKFAPPPPDGENGGEQKHDAPRQNTAPSATSKRAITIKARQQAVAPIRKPINGRMGGSEAVSQAALNLGKLFGGK